MFGTRARGLIPGVAGTEDGSTTPKVRTKIGDCQVGGGRKERVEQLGKDFLNTFNSETK